MLQLNRVGKIYDGGVFCRALTDIELTVEPGEFVGIMGPSGSGKTTLLHLIAALDFPTSGEVKFEDFNPHLLTKSEQARFRRRELGLIFQDFNLFDTLTVQENIVLPLALDGLPATTIADRVEKIANRLGIGDILHKRTHEISGGAAYRLGKGSHPQSQNAAVRRTDG